MFITYNGQFVYTKQNLIYAKPFSKNILEKLFAYADENYRQVMFGGETKVAGSLTIRLSQSPVMQRYLRFVPKKFPVGVLKNCCSDSVQIEMPNGIPSLDILREPIYQCIMLSPESEKRKAKAKLPSCDFKRSMPIQWISSPRKARKWRNPWVLAYEGIAIEEAMAFGDHENDIEMLKGVGIGVAMGNAQQAAKDSGQLCNSI